MAATGLMAVTEMTDVKDVMEHPLVLLPVNLMQQKQMDEGGQQMTAGSYLTHLTGLMDLGREDGLLLLSGVPPMAGVPEPMGTPGPALPRRFPWARMSGTGASDGNRYRR